MGKWEMGIPIPDADFQFTHVRSMPKLACVSLVVTSKLASHNR